MSENGYAYFFPDNPFMPKLDIQGTSSLRDYNIRVYITGTPSDPVTVLTSDPPLPQEQIVALLGTGATAQELTGKQRRPRRCARRSSSCRICITKFSSATRPGKKESFLTRFELNPGAIDPRTGRQEVSARFKATDQVYLVGQHRRAGRRERAGRLSHQVQVNNVIQVNFPSANTPRFPVAVCLALAFLGMVAAICAHAALGGAQITFSGVTKFREKGELRNALADQIQEIKRYRPHPRIRG